MKTVGRQVLEFHDTYELSAPDWPVAKIGLDDLELRLSLLREEFVELIDELDLGLEDIDPASVLKELVDLVYVAVGTAVTFGWDFDAAFDEVHRSNMSKVLPDGSVLRRDDGKVLKGPNYVAPDLSAFVRP